MNYSRLPNTSPSDALAHEAAVIRMAGLGQQIAGALEEATGQQPLVMATSEVLTVHMSQAHSELLLTKLEGAA